MKPSRYNKLVEAERHEAAERLGVDVADICTADAVARVFTRDEVSPVDMLNQATARYLSSKSARQLVDNVFTASPLAVLGKLHHDARTIGVEPEELSAARNIASVLTS